MRERVVAYAALAIVLAYLATIAFGPRDSPIATAFIVVAMPIVGFLGWSLMGAPVLETASWAIPLLIWDGAIYLLRPPDPIALLGFIAGAIWFAVFFSWSPVVEWWYARVLRRDLPENPGDE